MTRMAILAFLALTTIAVFVAYLLGFAAGQREQEKANRAEWIRDIEALRRAEDDRVPVDPYVARFGHLPMDEYRKRMSPEVFAVFEKFAGSITAPAETFDEWDGEGD